MGCANSTPSKAVAPAAAAPAPAAETTAAAPAQEVGPEVPAAAPVAVAEEKKDEATFTEQIFDNAHTVYGWEEKPVATETIHELIRLTQLAPTAFNCCPARFTFYSTADGKEKVAAAGMGGNVDTTKAAPLVAVLSVDKQWIEKMDILCPAYGGAKGISGALGNNQAAIDGTGNLNAHVQLGYFILAARSLGLGAGPMTGFDFAAVDAAVGKPDLAAFAVVRLGYAAPNPSYVRKDRLTFEQAATLI